MTGLLTSPVAVDAGRRVFTPHTSVFSRRIGVRATIVTVSALLAAAAVGIFALTLGDVAFSPAKCS